MQLNKQQLDQLETPCVVIDVEQARRNINAMQQQANDAGCLLRPHIKTHKMPLFARMQIDAGARGITCAKVSEAEVMAAGGIKDIFIAYPMVGDFRIKRAIRLAKKLPRLILAVDSLDGAAALNVAAEHADIKLEVRLEIDTGAGRTGVSVAGAPELATAISGMGNLNLTGIYTFKSLVYKGQPTENNALAAEEEGEIMQNVASAIRMAGVDIQDVSAGSSPTGVQVAQTGKVNEIRPGTYIFKDLLLHSERVAELPEVAVRFVATVVSANYPHYAVLDGGTKTFPTDIPLQAPPFFYKGYAEIEGHPHLTLSRMNEEHGIVTSSNGETGLCVGQKISLLPIHVCTAINMQNSVYLLENGVLRKQIVDARGMVV